MAFAFPAHLCNTVSVGGFEISRRAKGETRMEQNHYLLTNLLSEEEERIITSITAHIEKGGKRPGIQQIANENYLSTTFIVKMCKRLGFDGYSELYYHLARQLSSGEKRKDNFGSTPKVVDKYLL